MTLTEIFVDKKPAKPLDLLDAWRDICETVVAPGINLERIRQLHMHLRQVMEQPVQLAVTDADGNPVDDRKNGAAHVQEG